MSEVALTSLLSAAGGAGLGLLYFGGLWWTVRRIPSARFPAALVLGSFLLRTAVTAIGLVVVSGGQPVPLVVAVAGFLVARTVLIRTIRPDRKAPPGGAASGPAAG